MITPTIRNALYTFQQAANRGTAVYVSSAIVQELREALEAEPKETGLPTGYIDPVAWCRSDDFAHAAQTRQSLVTWRDQHPDCDMALYAHSQASAALKAEPEGEVPSDKDFFRVAEQAAHIDQDGIVDALEEGYPLELTAMDILEICRAVYRLARTAAPPASEPAPAPEEVGELVTWLHDYADAYRGYSASGKATRTATLLQQQTAELAALRGVPVAVSERPWERREWCDEQGRCWLGSVGSRNNDPGWVYRKPHEILHQTISLPHNAIPLPAPQAGEWEA